MSLARYAKHYSNSMIKDFLDNFLPKSKKKMVFVYCENAPWTGGAIPDSNNPNVVKIVSPGGCHSDDILNENYFPKEWREKSSTKSMPSWAFEMPGVWKGCKFTYNTRILFLPRS